MINTPVSSAVSDACRVRTLLAALPFAVCSWATVDLLREGWWSPGSPAAALPGRLDAW